MPVSIKINTKCRFLPFHCPIHLSILILAQGHGHGKAFFKKTIFFLKKCARQILHMCVAHTCSTPRTQKKRHLVSAPFLFCPRKFSISIFSPEKILFRFCWLQEIYFDFVCSGSLFRFRFQSEYSLMILINSSFSSSFTSTPS